MLSQLRDTDSVSLALSTVTQPIRIDDPSASLPHLSNLLVHLSSNKSVFTWVRAATCRAGYPFDGPLYPNAADTR